MVVMSLLAAHLMAILPLDPWVMEESLCPAGETQSCAHISALLFTLSTLEVSPRACTSLSCGWSRPSRTGMAVTAVELDFWKASAAGYMAPVGPALDSNKLLHECNKAGILTGAGS